MKTLIIFTNSARIVAEKGALVLPQSPHNIVTKIDLVNASASEISQLTQNPYNDQLLAKFRKNS